ncbi:MAG: YHS domain-containing protein [Hyphomicrobiales bacterium]|nr:YHS domain-containing protein [Hyphomicrobiales bacterium]
MPALPTPTHPRIGVPALLLPLVVLSVLLFTSPAPAGEIYVSSWSGAAIQGADPVAYFTQGKAVQGSKDHTLQWRGATWRFASAGNLALFKADPERYAPQFGGYCAFAVSKGATAEIDPKAWSIVNGKLYLNYSPGVRDTWARDVDGNIAKAEANWPALRQGLAK